MMDLLKRKAVLGTAFLVFFASLPTASPAAMAVSPLRVDLSDGNTKGAIQVSNQDDKPRSYQVEIVAWSQSDEQRELYTPTEDLIAVPPLFTLEPGESQQVRVGMLAAADSVVERSYRMFITELEPPRQKGEQKVGLTMRMQIGVPVFVEPGSAEPEVGLKYVGLVQKDDQTFVRFHNDGNIHVKVIEARFKARGSEDWLNQTAVFYMLPGSSGLLPVALPEGASAGTMVIVTDGHDELTYELAEAT